MNAPSMDGYAFKSCWHFRTWTVAKTETTATRKIASTQSGEVGNHPFRSKIDTAKKTAALQRAVLVAMEKAGSVFSWWLQRRFAIGAYSEIIPDQTSSSPEYATKNCPGVIALCGTEKTASNVSSVIPGEMEPAFTLTDWSSCRYRIFAIPCQGNSKASDVHFHSRRMSWSEKRLKSSEVPTTTRLFATSLRMTKRAGPPPTRMSRRWPTV